MMRDKNFRKPAATEANRYMHGLVRVGKKIISSIAYSFICAANAGRQDCVAVQHIMNEIRFRRLRVKILPTNTA